jgi:hypothetical protein
VSRLPPVIIWRFRRGCRLDGFCVEHNPTSAKRVKGRPARPLKTVGRSPPTRHGSRKHRPGRSRAG